MSKLRLVSGLHKNPPRTSPWTLREFWEKRNSILIVRSTGGLGDILMHRMIFEDFKILNPEIKIVFACPPQFMAAVQDHPFIDGLVDCTQVNPNDYLKHFDTTTICGRTEMLNAPLSSPHRSDIWADWCGIQLTKHDMHLRLSEDEKSQAKAMVEAARTNSGPSIAFAPISAISSKNLDLLQWTGVIEGLKKLGCFVYGLHSQAIPGFEAPILIGNNIRNFMALVAAADYVISVDSAAFHVAGGLGKPMVGIFGWADGKVYGKYYNNWELVQRHRDDRNWSCGPCYTWGACVKCPAVNVVRKPCISEIRSEEIVEAMQRLLTK
jgi:ADP-heptose:LPS heptosyltransferase